MQSLVPIGDMKIGQTPDVLATDTLGSCLCLTVYDPVLHMGGLLHAMLPLSKINTQKAALNPFMFVDTGIPELFQALSEDDPHKERWKVKAVGCGNPMGTKEVFKIGERNYRVLQEILSEEGICLAGEDVGGTISRKVALDLASGQTIVYSNGTENVL
ncbi:MAG: chemotaxis protein CheD [Deltaproteobacteria bacterium]|jgi:chemotaxis protein CheD